VIPDLVWMSLSGLVAALAPVLAAKAGKVSLSLILVAAELVGSIGIALRMIHPGPILWFFVPFWSGLAVAVLAIFLLGPSRYISKAETE